jgi:eight-cysteine-cluster-containing protein
MEGKPGPLILVAVLGAVMFASGCTGIDPTAIATSNSMVQQFLDEHPNAEIKLTHFTAEQAKNMIDQIRSDCDNPYLDEKEFYRVNVTDPDTDFFAVVWIDWTNRSIECVYKIGTDGKTIEKPRHEEQCESHTYYKCDSGNLYWFDSCGNKQEKKAYCQYGCSGQSCLGNCTSHAAYRCYGDHVYWFDSCGNKQEKKEYCDYGCDNGFCNAKPAEKTCLEMGGYCIWPATATAASEAGGASAATGMLIVTAVATSTTTQQVVYQCQDGYELGSYFCKEGGICCVPQSYPPPIGFCGNYTNGPCSSDSDCITSGCSGQICQSVQEEPVITTCDYRDCYDAVKYGMECKCMGSPTATAAGNAGKCMWTKSVACTADAKICPDGTSVGRNPTRNCEFDPCPSVTCTDSDGGKNYNVQGAAASGGQNYTDHCNSDGTLTEKYCSESGQISAEVYQCPYGCLEGACTTQQTQSCTDSDGGQNYYQIGTATAAGQSLTDHCNEDGTLTEKYCSGNEIAAEVYQCPYGCSDGVCLKQQTAPTCTDTDGGYGFTVKGIVSGYQNGYPYSYTDSCNSTTLLNEWYCSGTTPQVYQYSCAMSSTTCSNGACAQTPAQNCGNGLCTSDETCSSCPSDCGACPTCTDTDGGLIYYKKGTVLYSGTSYNDFCSSSTTLAEYSCSVSGTPPGISYYTCPSGCSNGACIQTSSGQIVCEDNKETGCCIQGGACDKKPFICSQGQEQIHVSCVYPSCEEIVQCVDKPSQCTDSDGGQNFYTLGSCNEITGYTYEDTCYTPSTIMNRPLTEYYCGSDGYCHSQEVSCESFGKRCVAGRCTSETCIDTDGGINIYKKGLAGFSSGTSRADGTDFCQSSSSVMEYYCSPDNMSIDHKLYSCPSGVCYDGACAQ